MTKYLIVFEFKRELEVHITVEADCIAQACENANSRLMDTFGQYIPDDDIPKFLKLARRLP